MFIAGSRQIAPLIYSSTTGKAGAVHLQIQASVDVNNSRDSLSNARPPETTSIPSSAHTPMSGIWHTTRAPNSRKSRNTSAFDGLVFSQPVRVGSNSVIDYGDSLGSEMILPFGDEPLSDTVSTLCPRCFATTRDIFCLKRAGPQGPGHD